MSNKLNLFAVVFLLFLAIFGCTSVDDSETTTGTEMVSGLIIGSAEHPDPVLEMVRDLEKEGVLQNVIVRESFPVQIEVTGPKSVIEKLQKMPRKVSPGFK
ncbi:hypothetical protein MNBD_GAMMA01-1447 [hydrothermal vent metagenome]|uniref:Uncharacterized protein n=1 Tax=hydrothermal vent metagenome TaxID=652676 RepID=A0A3B0VE21_9ZZZZ